DGIETHNRPAPSFCPGSSGGEVRPFRQARAGEPSIGSGKMSIDPSSIGAVAPTSSMGRLARQIRGVRGVAATMIHKEVGSRGCASVLWGTGFFLAAQVAFLLGSELFFPEVCDPESGIRLAQLRERISEGPDRPLLLLLGSSRTVMAFRPE